MKLYNINQEYLISHRSGWRNVTQQVTDNTTCDKSLIDFADKYFNPLLFSRKTWYVKENSIIFKNAHNTINRIRTKRTKIIYSYIYIHIDVILDGIRNIMNLNSSFNWARFVPGPENYPKIFWLGRSLRPNLEWNWISGPELGSQARDGEMSISSTMRT